MTMSTTAKHARTSRVLKPAPMFSANGQFLNDTAAFNAYEAAFAEEAQDAATKLHRSILVTSALFRVLHKEPGRNQPHDFVLFVTGQLSEERTLENDHSPKSKFMETWRDKKLEHVYKARDTAKANAKKATGEDAKKLDKRAADYGSQITAGNQMFARCALVAAYLYDTVRERKWIDPDAVEFDLELFNIYAPSKKGKGETFRFAELSRHAKAHFANKELFPDRKQSTRGRPRSSEAQVTGFSSKDAFAHVSAFLAKQETRAFPTEDLAHEVLTIMAHLKRLYGTFEEGERELNKIDPAHDNDEQQAA